MSDYVRIYQNVINGINAQNGLTDDDKSKILSQLMHQIDNDTKEARKILKSSPYYKGKFSFKTNSFKK